MPVKRAVARLMRAALRRYVRARPRARDLAGADRRVYILLNTAYGMGGTIRANLNLAGHLARTHDVQIISVARTREKPFFPFPPGVEVVWLEDRRPSYAAPRGLRLVHRLLRERSSLLVHPADIAYDFCNLWVDVMLVRRLRRKAGFLITTRPAFNLIAAQLSPPGLVTIGQEQMNLRAHRAALRKAMVRHYDKLDVLAVLTEPDKRSYGERLNGRLRLERIPNTVRDDLGPAQADLDAKVILTAGRLTRQKGYDLLIPAFAQVAEAHPDWRLRICGRGRDKEALQNLIAEYGMGEAISLERPARDLGREMERASIYVLSSRFEGLPLVLIEAMSKGMAVVSFDCPTGPGDVVEDGVNGLLVPPADVDALAAGIRQLIEDADLRRGCAAAAVETARGYTIDSVGPRWEALLDDLSRRRPAHAAG